MHVATDQAAKSTKGQRSPVAAPAAEPPPVRPSGGERSRTTDIPAAVAATFPPTLEAVPGARRLAERLDPRLDPAALEDLRLVTTELVANALRHALPGPVGVAIGVQGASIRVEVTNAGGDRAVEQSSWPTSRGGHGLVIVDRVAERWGVEYRDSTTVWADLPVPAP